MNYPLLAEAGIEIKYQKQFFLRQPGGTTRGPSEFEYADQCVENFSGITPYMVEPCCKHRKLKALILETFGSGNATTAKWFITTLQKSIRRIDRIKYHAV